LASSISSRTSTVSRSVTSVTVAAMLSGFPFSAAKALQDDREQEPTDECCAGGDLGPLCREDAGALDR
jgi:hypothetical protein